MSTPDDEPTTGISDEDLPEDLQPTEDNPLAQPLEERDDAKSPEELDVMGGKLPEQSAEDSEDSGDGGDSGS